MVRKKPTRKTEGGWLSGRRAPEALDPLTAVEALTASLTLEDDFVKPESEVQERMAQATKVLSDYGKTSSFKAKSEVFPALFVDGADGDQIWQQLQMKHASMLKFLRKRVRYFLREGIAEAKEDSAEEDQESKLEEEEEEEEEEEDEEEDEDEEEQEYEGEQEEQEENEENEDEEEEEGEDEDPDEGASASERNEESAEEGSAKAILKGDDDKRKLDIASLEHDGFNFAEMERLADDFGNNSSDGEEGDEGDDFDMMQPISGGEELRFDDFFDPVDQLSADRVSASRKRKLGSNDSEIKEGIQSVTAESKDKPLSRTAKLNRTIAKQIEEMEEQLLQPRQWDLQGEVMAFERPADALLEKDLDVETAIAPTEPVTQLTTASLEAMIKQRILDDAFDDVERKIEAKEKHFVPKEEVSSEKSSLGLAEVYEKQYLEQAKIEDGLQTEAESKLSAKHTELAAMLSSLCLKLDSLCSFHFTPKPIDDAVEIVGQHNTNLPSIAMEEVIPIAVSTSSSMTPQDFYKSKSRGELVERSEMTQEEKRSKRRRKKRKNKATKEAKERAAQAKQEEIAYRQQKRESKKKRFSKTKVGEDNGQRNREDGEREMTEGEIKSFLNMKNVISGSTASADFGNSSSKFFANLQSKK